MQSLPTNPYYASTYVRLLFDYLASKGLDGERILGEPPPDAGHRGLVRYSSARWQGFLEKAAKALDDPLLGLHLGRTIKPEHLGVLGYVIQACRDAGSALLRWQQFEKLVTNMANLHLHMEGASVVLEWVTSHQSDGWLSDETVMVASVELCRKVVAESFALEEVCFLCPPPQDVSPYLDYFGCPVRFAQPEMSIRLAATHLALPMRQADEALQSFMEQQAKAMLAELPPMDDLEETVRRAIARLAREGEISIERVAGDLNLTSRSLHRKLAKLGCNFRGLREDTRRLLAQDYLKDPRLALGEVAWLLGYSELSAFSRAFKRWTGHSPSEVRLTQSH
ncbi:MAG: AraC family transcriptional regulator [Aquabacterium sp.]|nr:AraC family transcriptional regulator [Aquabacterium sp.]